MAKTNPGRLSVILGSEQKAALERLARWVSNEAQADVTVSDLVRDAIEAYLAAHASDQQLRRLAEEKTVYTAEPD